MTAAHHLAFAVLASFPAAALSEPVVDAPPAMAPAAAPAAADPGGMKMVCKVMRDSGSRLRSEKVCAPLGDWKQGRTNSRRFLERLQNGSSLPKG